VGNGDCPDDRFLVEGMGEMPIDRLEVERTSIIIVYVAIDTRQISRDRLQEMIPGENPQLVEAPGGPLIVNYEALPDTNCVINNRRIYLNQGGPIEPGEGNLAQMATVAVGAIRGSTIVAYGKNFHVKGSVESVDNMGHFLRDRFLRDSDQLEEAFEGPVSWLSPRFKYVVGNIEYQLGIDPYPGDDTLFKARLNIHHATDSLPGLEDLRLELREGFQYFSEVLNRVLSVGASS